MIADIEEVISLDVGFPLILFPRQTGICQEVGLIVLYVAVEVSIGAHAVLPSGNEPEVEVARQLQSEVTDELVVQVFQGVLRYDALLLFLVLIDVAVTQIKHEA